MSRNKSKRKKVLKHPIFLECAKLETEEFWQSTLRNCAYDGFPCGITFKDSILYYRKSRKKPAVNFRISKEPEKALVEIKNIFKSKIRMISRNELVQKQIRMMKRIRAARLPVDMKWSNIRSPKTAKQIICMFVWKQTHELGLTKQQANQLEACISVGLEIKTLISNDVHMCRGEIVSINGLVRLKNGFFTIRDPRSENIHFHTKKTVEQHSCLYKWPKYQNDYINKVNGTYA